MTIDKAELEAKIQEYLETLDDLNEKKIVGITEREVHNNCFTALISWLFKADIEKEERRKLYEQLKAEFEPENVVTVKVIHPKPEPYWQRNGDNMEAWVAGMLRGKVCPERSSEGWVASRFNYPDGSTRPCLMAQKAFDTIEIAKAWAVGHL